MDPFEEVKVDQTEDLAEAFAQDYIPTDTFVPSFDQGMIGNEASNSDIMMYSGCAILSVVCIGIKIVAGMRNKKSEEEGDQFDRLL